MTTLLKNSLDWAISLFAAFMAWVVLVVEKFGYPGILFMMFLESTFVPLPSEIVMPPAGYLSAQGKASLLLVILAGTAGSTLGATFNYYLGKCFGRKFLIKYAKYFFLNKQRIDWIDGYFKNHGEITTLIGRFLPGVRHYISFPAGICNMHLGKFLLYTTIGAGIWVIILALIGRSVGRNIDLIKAHLHTVLIISIPIMVFAVVVYVLIKKRMGKKSHYATNHGSDTCSDQENI